MVFEGLIITHFSTALTSSTPPPFSTSFARLLLISLLCSPPSPALSLSRELIFRARR